MVSYSLAFPGFLGSAIYGFWPFTDSRTTFQLISDPLVAFDQQNKMLRSLSVLGFNGNGVP